VKLFLSYPAKSTPKASELEAALQADGVEALSFFSDYDGNRSDVPAVNEWRQAAMDSSDAVLVLLTEYSYHSRGLAQEIVYAISQGIPVIAVQLDAEVRVPFGLLNHEVLDVSEQDIADAAGQIKRETQRLLAAKAAEDSVRIGDEIQAAAREVFKEDRPMARIFIAYSRKQRSIAKALSEMLVRRGQLHFWDAKIHAGASWRQTIQRALDDCTHLLVIWTEDAAESNEVEREVSYALAEGKVIIPILSQDIPKLPYHLHGFHYVVLPEDVTTIEHEIMAAIESIPNEDIWQ
jgi:nucleoside 2-deoxyribosyltransferase